MSATLRWGDLPIIRDTESGIAAIEREQMTKPRPLEVDGPPLYQPSSADHISSTNSLYDARDDFSLDVMTQHTLQLLQYSHQLTSLIEDAHQQIEQLKSGEVSVLSCVPAPPLPTWQPPKKKHLMVKPFAVVPDGDDSLFIRGISETSSSAISLDERTSKLLLRRSVAAICAHVGFDSCNQSVLDTLTDVCQEYYRQLLTLLRAAVDAEAYHGGSGFPDAITRVFYEMGIGSLCSVYDFYQSRVVGYHSRLMQKCIDMRDEYEQMRKPRTNSSADELTASSKGKDDSSSVIHFPSTDEADETGDMEQVDQLEGLGLDMSISQESSTTPEDEASTGKWKSEAAGNAKHEQNAPEDRLSSSESCVSGGQGDAFHLSSHLSSDSKRTSAGVISPPAATAAFLLKPPLKKFKK